MTGLTVGLLNDSFPPTVDGVANTALNYARYIEKNHGTAVVATPWYPHVRDDYPFTVVRYPSAYISKKMGYRAGYPFDIRVLSRLEKKNLDIIHTHCPFISALLARVLRFQTGAPVVFTYHTKFDIDIEKRVALNPVRSASIRFILSNINACDEVWVVSRSAGENLRGLGYTGEYVVMENGTDFPRGRAEDQAVNALREQYDIRKEEAVFLFVGRMMWYKNVKLSIDGLRLAKERGSRFKMLFVGDGVDLPAIRAYAKECGLEEDCIFAGAIRDRELLRVYFSMADLFLFPSTYDTNGLVVKEAAACGCPSLLVTGSGASEGIVDGETGILIEETPEDMARAVTDACENRTLLRSIGEEASEKVYLSWEDAVARAFERYQVVLSNYEKSTDKPPMNEIYYENVQRVKDDLAYRKEKIICSYRNTKAKCKENLLRILSYEKESDQKDRKEG